MFPCLLFRTIASRTIRACLYAQNIPPSSLWSGDWDKITACFHASVTQPFSSWLLLYPISKHQLLAQYSLYDQIKKTNQGCFFWGLADMKRTKSRRLIGKMNFSHCFSSASILLFKTIVCKNRTIKTSAISYRPKSSNVMYIYIQIYTYIQIYIRIYKYRLLA